jgi:hypothetical protein
LQFCLHLSHRQGVSAKVEKVIVHADAWDSQRILPRGCYDTLNLIAWSVSGFVLGLIRG